MFPDFEEFKSEKSFFFSETDKISIANGTVNISPQFARTFPALTSLINKASLLNVTINDVPFSLYSWKSKEGRSCGWLCKTETGDINNIQILQEHQLLIDNMGGIQESYNEPDDSFTNNQNFLFIKDQCESGLSWDDYYTDACEGESEDIVPIPLDNLVSFVKEANGAETLYDLETKQVYLFSHDHSFDYVTFVEGQPKYTFHYINEVNNFTDYVEALAGQWIDHIE